MEVGIVGKPNVGKSTFFNALTLLDVPMAPYPFTTTSPNRGVAAVRAPCPHVDRRAPCTPGNAKCVDGTRWIPVNLVDVPGPRPGRPRGQGARPSVPRRPAGRGRVHPGRRPLGGDDAGGRDRVPPGTYDPSEEVRLARGGARRLDRRDPLPGLPAPRPLRRARRAGRSRSSWPAADGPLDLPRSRSRRAPDRPRRPAPSRALVGHDRAPWRASSCASAKPRCRGEQVRPGDPGRRRSPHRKVRPDPLSSRRRRRRSSRSAGPPAPVWSSYHSGGPDVRDPRSRPSSRSDSRTRSRRSGRS